MTVALTIKNPEVERLAAEVARLTGETKTQAIRVALQERRSRLAAGVDRDARRAELLRFMQDEIWAHVPAELRGQPHDSARDDALLGYGSDGLPE
jgi:antitoxin VapB